MSGRLLRLVCTTAMAAGFALAPLPATAGPEAGGKVGPTAGSEAGGEAGPTAGAEAGPEVGPGERPVAELLTDLQRLYREAEQATETYNGTEEQLKRRRAEAGRLDAELARARLALRDSRGAAARLARRQYQYSGAALSPYVRLLLARDPQRALEQGRVIARLARDRARTVGRLTGGEKKAEALARQARAALDAQRALTARRKEERDAVRDRLRDVEEMIASLSPEQLTALAAFEEAGTIEAQRRFMASGAMGDDDGKPSAEGGRALRFAVEQLGKPYEWGAEGPGSYDCSGLTSVAWQRAGTPIPRTSQEQWARLQRVPLDRLRPGDLVVYFPEATHVAMYLGDGKVVQAPRPGAEVKVSPIAANPVLGAVRPDPDAEPVPRYVPPRLPAGATDGSDTGYGAEGAPDA